MGEKGEGERVQRGGGLEEQIEDMSLVAGGKGGQGGCGRKGARGGHCCGCGVNWVNG